MAIRSLIPGKVYKRREIEAYYDHHDDVVDARQNGTSHKVYRGRSGKTFVVPVGAGECPRGTLKSILLQAAAAGVFGFLLLLAFAPQLISLAHLGG